MTDAAGALLGVIGPAWAPVPLPFWPQPAFARSVKLWVKQRHGLEHMSKGGARSKSGKDAFTSSQHRTKFTRVSAS